jgi:hypothetical protein
MADWLAKCNDRVDTEDGIKDRLYNSSARQRPETDINMGKKPSIMSDRSWCLTMPMLAGC